MGYNGGWEYILGTENIVVVGVAVAVEGNEPVEVVVDIVSSQCDSVKWHRLLGPGNRLESFLVVD